MSWEWEFHSGIIWYMSSCLRYPATTRRVNRERRVPTSVGIPAIPEMVRICKSVLLVVPRVVNLSYSMCVVHPFLQIGDFRIQIPLFIPQTSSFLL